MPLTEKLDRLLRPLREWVTKRFAGERRTMAPKSGCIARQYAQCDDFEHCPYCSTVEQALRTAYWIKLKWPWLDGRNPF